MRAFSLILTITLYLTLSVHAAPEKAKQVTQYGITWRFDKEYTVGTFCNGDYWVLGPVKVTGISNNYHTHGFSPNAKQDGSMIDPDGGWSQGYDGMVGSYNAKLNAARPNGNPVSASNPVMLKAGSSLVSAVSWLFESKGKAEPGCPRFNGGTRAPRPVLRAAAVLTCVGKVPAADAFRPPYCGSTKVPKFTKSQLRLDLLPKLTPPASTPNLAKMERAVERAWIDHPHQYLGAMLHPSENMPQYGKDMSIQIGHVGLMLLLDFDKLPGKPSNETLLIRYVQLGIDLAGIADNKGSWPSNGGHHMGRKWPILFSGLMLNDSHMLNVGKWTTAFQEDHDTFYVSQKAIDITHGASWRPDKRSKKLPYESKHLGLPEWGIVHRKKPTADNLNWSATYRNINGMAYVGFALAARIMGQKKAWNHDPLFDYVDRWVAVAAPRARQPKHVPGVYGGSFTQSMWTTYRAKYGPVWTPDNPQDIYSTGKLK